MAVDCDGVLLNSNAIKTGAFGRIAHPYGVGAAEVFVVHHKAHGGVSRIRKFEYLIREIVGREPAPGEIEALCEAYAAVVVEGLKTCEIAPGLAELRAAAADTRWMVVSGGAENELRALFAERGLDGYFDGGIFGNPASKDEILAREIEAGRLVRPALFVGDARYDYEAATRAGLDFVFVAGWSDFDGGAEYFRARGVPVIQHLNELAPIIADRNGEPAQ